MSRSRMLIAMTVTLAVAVASPAGAQAATQTVTDPVGDAPSPSLDIVSRTIRSDARYLYVTTTTAARLSNRERFFPIVSIWAVSDDWFRPEYGVSKDGVFDGWSGAPNVFTGTVQVRRGPRSITYRFTRSSINKLSPFHWNVATIASDGAHGDFTAPATFTP